MDELDGHVDFFAGTSDRSLDDAVDAKRSRYLRQGAANSLVLHDRGSGDNAEGRVLGQHGDKLIGHSVGEVILRGIAGEVIERNNGQRSDLRSCERAQESSCQTAPSRTYGNEGEDSHRSEGG